LIGLHIQAEAGLREPQPVHVGIERSVDIGCKPDGMGEPFAAQE
jgi:hypothetical protein